MKARLGDRCDNSWVIIKYRIVFELQRIMLYLLWEIDWLQLYEILIVEVLVEVVVGVVIVVEVVKLVVVVEVVILVVVVEVVVSDDDNDIVMSMIVKLKWM